MKKIIEEIRKGIEKDNLTKRTEKVALALGYLEASNISKDEALKVIRMCLFNEI